MTVKRLPAETCAICDRPFSEIGGVRIYWTASRTVLVMHRNVPFPNLERFSAVRLEGKYSEMFLIYSGDGWTQETIDRTVIQANDGLAPWFCQKCGNRSCSRCGAPLRVAAACEVLHDDGTTGHMPTIPSAARGCINPACERYRG